MIKQNIYHYLFKLTLITNINSTQQNYTITILSINTKPINTYISTTIQYFILYISQNDI